MTTEDIEKGYEKDFGDISKPDIEIETIYSKLEELDMAEELRKTLKDFIEDDLPKLTQDSEGAKKIKFSTVLLMINFLRSFSNFIDREIKRSIPYDFSITPCKHGELDVYWKDKPAEFSLLIVISEDSHINLSGHIGGLNTSCSPMPASEFYLDKNINTREEIKEIFKKLLCPEPKTDTIAP